MNDTEYLKKFIALTEELERAADARPYDPDVYNDVVRRLNSLTHPLQQRRRRRPWGMIAFVISLLLFLAWFVFEVLSVLYTKGPQ